MPASNRTKRAKLRTPNEGPGAPAETAGRRPTSCGSKWCSKAETFDSSCCDNACMLATAASTMRKLKSTLQTSERRRPEEFADKRVVVRTSMDSATQNVVAKACLTLDSTCAWDKPDAVNVTEPCRFRTASLPVGLFQQGCGVVPSARLLARLAKVPAAEGVVVVAGAEGHEVVPVVGELWPSATAREVPSVAPRERALPAVVEGAGAGPTMFRIGRIGRGRGPAMMWWMVPDLVASSGCLMKVVFCPASAAEPFTAAKVVVPIGGSVVVARSATSGV